MNASTSMRAGLPGSGHTNSGCVRPLRARPPRSSGAAGDGGTALKKRRRPRPFGALQQLQSMSSK